MTDLKLGQSPKDMWSGVNKGSVNTQIMRTSNIIIIIIIIEKRIAALAS